MNEIQLLNLIMVVVYSRPLIIYRCIALYETMADYAETCQECEATCCKAGGTDFDEVEKNAVLNAGHEDF